MVRLLAISGSLRAASTNTLILRAAMAAAPEGVEIVLYEGMGSLPIFTPDLTEALPTAAAELRARLARADGLLIASPEYAHGVPGGMKNALDWIVGWGEVAETPVALFNTSEYGEHAKGALTEILKTMSMHIVPEAGLTLHLRGKKPTEIAPILADAATRKLLQDTLVVFAGAIHARPRPIIA